jgi:hypothetical protein
VFTSSPATLRDTKENWPQRYKRPCLPFLIEAKGTLYELFNWPATRAVYAASSDKVKDNSLSKSSRHNETANIKDQSNAIG